MSPVIAALPVHRMPKSLDYLYAIQFKDGRIKIGVTWNPRARASALAAQFRAEVVRAVAVEYRGRFRQAAEADALCRIRGMALSVRGYTELFSGLTFGSAQTLLQQICRRNFDAPQTPFSQTKEGRRAAAQAKQKQAEARAAAVFGRLMGDLVQDTNLAEPA